MFACNQLILIFFKNFPLLHPLNLKSLPKGNIISGFAAEQGFAKGTIG